MVGTLVLVFIYVHDVVEVLVREDGDGLYVCV